MVKRTSGGTIVTSPLKASDCIRIEASDPRSDDRRRVVEVGRESVTIRRSVAGVPMAIRLASSAYRGVVLRVAGLESGRFHYEVRLTHRDPDLSVPLGEGDDLSAIEGQWRGWVAFLGLPALAGRTELADTPVNLAGVDLAFRTPHPRRRGRPLTGRRRRFPKRGAPCPVRFPGVLKAESRVLVYGREASSPQAAISIGASDETGIR